MGAAIRQSGQVENVVDFELRKPRKVTDCDHSRPLDRARAAQEEWTDLNLYPDHYFKDAALRRSGNAMALLCYYFRRRDWDTNLVPLHFSNVEHVEGALGLSKSRQSEARKHLKKHGYINTHSEGWYTVVELLLPCLYSNQGTVPESGTDQFRKAEPIEESVPESGTDQFRKAEPSVPESGTDPYKEDPNPFPNPVSKPEEREIDLGSGEEGKTVEPVPTSPPSEPTYVKDLMVGTQPFAVGSWLTDHGYDATMYAPEWATAHLQDQSKAGMAAAWSRLLEEPLDDVAAACPGADRRLQKLKHAGRPTGAWYRISCLTDELTERRRERAERENPGGQQHPRTAQEKKRVEPEEDYSEALAMMAKLEAETLRTRGW